MDTPQSPLPLPAVPGSARTAKDHAILMAYDAFGLCLGSPPRNFPASEVLRWMQCVMTEQLKENGYHKCSHCDTLISRGSPAVCPSCQDSADTKRLDWLIAQGAFISHSRDGEVCNAWLSQDPNDEGNGAVPAEGYPQKCYHDAREAIDAAMGQPNVSDQATASGRR